MGAAIANINPASIVSTAPLTTDDENLLNEDGEGNSLVPAQPESAAPETSTPQQPEAPAQDEPSMQESTEVEEKPAESVEQPPMEPAPSVEQPADEVTQLRQQLAAMQAELERVSGVAVQQPTQRASKELETGKTFTTATDWIKDEAELQDFGVDVKATNAILDKVRNATREETTQAVLQNIPAYVMPMIRRSFNIERAINQLWAAKPHLRPYTQYMSAVTSEVQAEHPEWEQAGEYSKIFAEAAKRVETRIPGLVDNPEAVPSSPVQQPVQQAQRTVIPPVISRPSARVPTAKLSPEEEEFLAMDKMR